jgi:hypothetical protein
VVDGPRRFCMWCSFFLLSFPPPPPDALPDGPQTLRPRFESGHEKKCTEKRTRFFPFPTCLRWGFVFGPIFWVVNSVRFYRVFHQLRQAKFDNSGSILSSSQFTLLPQKMKIASKVFKIDPK